jgi:methionine-R-sulfoxide reductase
MKTNKLFLPNRAAWLALVALATTVALSCQAPRLGGTEEADMAPTRQADSWHGWTVLPEGSEPEFPVRFSEAEWRVRLTPRQFQVLRQEATEPACSGAFWNEHRKGDYYSAATGQPLFRSDSKFDSGTGWPSFFQPVNRGAVVLRWDRSLGMERIEVLDASSGSHLGHVFDDGPSAGEMPGGTGLRFCMNSEALLFVPDGQEEPALVKEWRAGHPGS